MPEVSPVPSLPAADLGERDVAAQVEHADDERVLELGIAAHARAGHWRHRWCRSCRPWRCR